MFSNEELRAAQVLVHKQISASPQISWPLLSAALGTQLIVKHENHLPTGAFKVRGGVTFMDWLRREHPDCAGIISATRGNHGQSQARAASAAGLRAVIYAPRGNSVEKNAAMRAYGLVEFGDDFDEARAEVLRVAESQELFPVPSFHPELVRGVASYGLEMFVAHRDLDVVYVPIGCGSGICSVIAVRDALGLDCEIVGVVSENAACAKLSVEAGRLIETNSADTIADGMAVRVPVRGAFEIYSKGAARIVAVSEAEIKAAMRLYFQGARQVAEGAGAAPLAAALTEKADLAGKKVAIVLSGGNVDLPVYQRVLSGAAHQP